MASWTHELPDGELRPAEDVAAADDDGDLHAMLGGGVGLPGDVQHGVHGDAALAGLNEAFAGNLQHHAAILRAGHRLIGRHPRHSFGNSQRMKPDQLHARLLGGLADGLLVVLDERLLGQAALGVEVAQPALDHLVDDLFGLAFLAGGLGEDFPLLGDHRRVQFLLHQYGRAHGGHVHADVLGQLTVAAVVLQQDAVAPLWWP